MKKAILKPDFSPRTYQQSIFAKSLDKNSLVVLPTGLGKTIIALMLAVYYYNKTNKKILFLAPTKPLVEQQEKTFKQFIKNENEFKFQTLVGTISPKKRINLYENSDFIFSTPQLIENDLINEIIKPSDFCYIIFDEAHRAIGSYSYCFIADDFSRESNTRFLALSASPGTSKDEINTIISNLKIEEVVVKSCDDPDVLSYVNKTKIEYIEVDMPKAFEEIRDLLMISYNKRLSKLKEIGVLHRKNLNIVTKTDLLNLQNELRAQIGTGKTSKSVWDAISISAALMKLGHGIELFESEEVSSAHTYFHNILRLNGDNSKAAKELSIDASFRQAYEKITRLKQNSVLHPKLIKLKELINSEIRKHKDLKIIIFSQYRDTVTKIVSELESIPNIKPSIFLGQAMKGGIKMSQKEQREILDSFRESKFNILVSTSVGEEGLDIPKVDLVIFYEPVPSAIRTIQRIGRTGRFNEGRVYILQTAGTRDIITRYIAGAKEKRMYKVLDEIKKAINSDTSDSGLNKFIREKKSSLENTNIENSNDAFDSRIPIYIDQRENTSLIKQLHKIDEIKTISKQLEVGDIIIDENIGIERKEKSDFVNSIIDKRLFPQLINLVRNYRRPILILEGSSNIFSLRNVNPNVIRASISAITVDLRIPIIYTDNIEETANMILTIAKRTKRPKKEVSLADSKKFFSQNEELEKVVSTIPKLNVVTAKSLLGKFKSLKNLANASEKDLLECEGIGKTRAKFISEFFKRKYTEI